MRRLAVTSGCGECPGREPASASTWAWRVVTSILSGETTPCALACGEPKSRTCRREHHPSPTIEAKWSRDRLPRVNVGRELRDALAWPARLVDEPEVVGRVENAALRGPCLLRADTIRASRGRDRMARNGSVVDREVSVSRTAAKSLRTLTACAMKCGVDDWLLADELS